MNELIAGVERELAAASAVADPNEKWSRLERAHVLSQPSAWQHIRVHVHMLRLAWRTRDGQEIFGQLVRIILAGPGSLAGRNPVGNSGRADVPLSANMPIASDLAEELRRAGKRTN